MLEKSKRNMVYLEGDGDDDEALPIESAEYSTYSDEYGEWLLILVRCPDYRCSIEIGIPLQIGTPLAAGGVYRGVAYDESMGGWLINLYYYTHGGVEDVVVTVDEVESTSAVFSMSGVVSGRGFGDLQTVCFTTKANKNPDLRKSFS